MIQSKMSVIELLPEEELLTLQNEKEQLVEKRAAGIKLLAELNAQLNGSFIENAGSSLMKKAAGRAGGTE